MNQEIISIRVDKKFTRKEIEEIKKRIALLQGGDFRSHQWFLIIKPIGQKYADQIRDHLAKRGIKITKEIETDLWRQMNLPLYIKDLNDERFEYFLYQNEFFGNIEGVQATILYLDGVSDTESIYKIKKEMRQIFVLPKYIMISPNIEKIMNPNAFHIPNEEDLAKEHNVLYNIIEKNIFSV